jgi:hypothetical protein
MRYVVATVVAVPFLLFDVSLRPDASTPSGTGLQLGTTAAEALAPFVQRFGFGMQDDEVTQDPAPASNSDEVNSDALAEAAAPARAMPSIGEFCAALAAAAQDNDLPVGFFARLIWQESNFRYAEVSHVGAQGVAQFMPATAAEVGLDDPFDPLKALPASARLLRKLRDQLGNIGLAAAAYNAGPGRIQAWLARRGPLPDETRNYVMRITGNAAEAWTAEARRISVPGELPRQAPCEGVGGLSRARQLLAMSVGLAPEIRTILDKVRLAEQAARKRAAEARLRLARRGKGTVKDTGKRTTIALAAKGRSVAHARAATRVASAER